LPLIGSYHNKINNSIQIYSKIDSEELSAKSSFISNYNSEVEGVNSEELNGVAYVGKTVCPSFNLIYLKNNNSILIQCWTEISFSDLKLDRN
jgi:hypothetical protein